MGKRKNSDQNKNRPAGIAALLSRFGRLRGSSPGKRRKGSGPGKAPIFILGILIAIYAGYLLIDKPAESPKQTVKQAAQRQWEEKPAPPAKDEKQPQPAKPAEKHQPAKDKPAIAKPAVHLVSIIVDDIGASRKVADEFLDIDQNITLSILPYLEESSGSAEAVRRRGKMFMVHMPMEPISYPQHDPGKNALFTTLDDSEVARRVNMALDALPGAGGVNNHMGSKFMQDREKVSIVLGEIKKRNLFFVDSRTDSNSVGFELSGEIGIPSAERDLFLDNELKHDIIVKYAEKLADEAMRSGRAVGICHPSAETRAALRVAIPAMKSRGIKIVPITELLYAGPEKIAAKQTGKPAGKKAE